MLVCWQEGGETEEMVGQVGGGPMMQATFMSLGFS